MFHVPHRIVAARSLRRLSVLVFVAGALATACAPADDTDSATCRSLVDSAADAIEPSDELRLLDRALSACSSYDQYAAELERHPGLLGYSVEAYIDRRCETVPATDLRRTPTCLTAHPPTTPPRTTTPQIVFVGTTLDGRLIEMRPSDAMPFVDDVPAEIQRTVEIAFASGCEGLREQRDTWVSRVDATPRGDIASVYAQHAQNVAVFTGCDIGAVPVPPGAP